VPTVLVWFSSSAHPEKMKKITLQRKDYAKDARIARYLRVRSRTWSEHPHAWVILSEKRQQCWDAIFAASQHCCLFSLSE
jgi:hypothetical protein